MVETIVKLFSLSISFGLNGCFMYRTKDIPEGKIIANQHIKPNEDRYGDTLRINCKYRHLSTQVSD